MVSLNRPSVRDQRSQEAPLRFTFAGVHGNNRLGGNSLLDCVVFGRVAGKHAAQYVMGTTVPTFLGDLSGAYKSGGAATASAYV